MSSRRDLLKGLLGCAVAPVCAEIPVEAMGLPGWLKLRQTGPRLMFARWLAEARAAQVRLVMGNDPEADRSVRAPLGGLGS